MTNAADGFLGRWAKRKNDALLGKPLVEPKQGPLTPTLPVALPAVATSVDAAAPPTVQEEVRVPALTLDDVKLLTKDSDFKPFMAQSVGPDVRNAAMKKLFEDPHFNIMDGLDIYIDDYSVSEPIPESMLRQMASAKFLNLFEDEEENDTAAKSAATASPDSARETANNPADQTVAQSYENPDISTTAAQQPENLSQAESAPSRRDFGASQQDHAHTDLRLQPDDATSGPEAGRRA